MKMKGTDIGGFAAILVAGYIIGKDNQVGEFSSMDLFLIVALLALGWYLAVHLS